MIEQILDYNRRFVAETVDLAKNHPLMPDGVSVSGYVMDSYTGELRPIE